MTTATQTFAAALAHGAITPVTDDVFAVQGAFKLGPGVHIGRTMTIARAGGELVLFNPVRLSKQGEVALDALGRVAHLVKLSDSHGVDEPYYRHRYEAKLWAFPGAKLDGRSADELLAGEGPIPGGLSVLYRGNAGWCEGAYLIAGGGGTLVTCDAIQNHNDHEFTSFGGRMALKVARVPSRVAVPSLWRRSQKLNREGLLDTLGPLRSLEFEHLVTGHGPASVGNASALVRKAIDAAAGLPAAR